MDMSITIEEYFPASEDTIFETLEESLKRVWGAICKLGIYGIKIKNTNSDDKATRLMEFSAELGLGFFSLVNIQKIDNAWSISAAKEEISIFGQSALMIDQDNIVDILRFLGNEDFAGNDFVTEIMILLTNEEDEQTPLLDRGIQMHNNDCWTKFR